MSPTCIICTEPLGHKEVTATRCGHVYHERCIERWLLHAGTCPQCRKPLTRSNLLHKLYFTLDDSVEDSIRIGQVNEETHKLREELVREQEAVEDLQKKLEDEVTKHHLTKTCCLVFKEAFQMRARKELQVLNHLQHDVRNFWLAVSREPLEAALAEAIWRKLVTISGLLNAIKQRHLQGSDGFVRRLWGLVTEIRNRTHQVRELERKLSRMQMEAAVQQRRLRAEKQRIQKELIGYQSRINELQNDLQAHERQTSEIAAENATLACLLEWHRQQACRNTPAAIPTPASRYCAHRMFWILSYPMRLLRQGLQCILNPMDDMMPFGNVSYTAELALYRRIVERNNLQKTAIFTVMSVLSLYMASWLKMHPAIALVASGVATGLIIPGAEYWRQP